MNRRQLLVSIGSVSITLIAGCTGDTEESDREQADANGDRGSGDSGNDDGDSGSDKLVEILDHEFYNNGAYDAGVSGTLENVSGEELSYVGVNVFYLDSEGVQIEEGLDNTTELAADRKWKFDAGYLGDDPSEIEEYEIKTDVTDY